LNRGFLQSSFLTSPHEGDECPPGFTGENAKKDSGTAGKKGKNLVPDAEIAAAEVVLREELAGRAEAPDLPHGGGVGCPAPAEEFGGLVFFQGMALVVLAYRAVLPADLPVLFRVGNTVFGLIEHALMR
jgi:hypothetical protein